MNDLINLIVQKTGISREAAERAAQESINFLKSKLPPALSGQLDAILSSGLNGGAGTLADKASGMLREKIGAMPGPNR